MMNQYEASPLLHTPDDTTNEPFIQPGTCDLHNQPFAIFCFEEQCNKMLCHTCFTALGHQNHGVMYLYQQEASSNSIRHENNPQTWASAMNNRRGQHPDNRAPQEITLSPTALNDRRGQYPGNHVQQEITLSPTALGISQDNSRWPRRNHRNKSHGSTRRSQYCKCVAIYLICLVVVIMIGCLYYIIAFKHIWTILTLADPRFHRGRKVPNSKVEVPTYDLAKISLKTAWKWKKLYRRGIRGPPMQIKIHQKDSYIFNNNKYIIKVQWFNTFTTFL